MNARLASLASALVLAGCAMPPAPGVEAARPLVLERFFAGRTVATGVFRNVLTGSERRLTAILNGRWDGRTLTLREDFLFDDGERDAKTWRLVRNPDGSFTGTREDVIGTASGRSDGAGFRLSYDAELGQAKTRVHFEDLMILRTDGSVLNTATVSKLGVAVGTVRLDIRRTARR